MSLSVLIVSCSVQKARKVAFSFIFCGQNNRKSQWRDRNVIHKLPASGCFSLRVDRLTSVKAAERFRQVIALHVYCICSRDMMHGSSALHLKLFW